MLGLFWLLASGGLVQSGAPAVPTPLGEAYYLFLEGRELEGRGDVDGAVRAYRRALDLAPGAADVHAELAGLYARQGRASESISEARAAIELDPDNREAHRMIGFVLATIADQRGDAAMRDEAIGHLEKALVANVRDPAVELTVGRLAVRAGRYPLAIQWLTSFLLDQTGYPEAMELLAEAYEASGRPADAAELVAELVAKAPDQVRLRSWLAELRESAGAWPEAASVWADLAASSPGGVVYPMRRAMALVNGGDLDGGRQGLVPAVAGGAPCGERSGCARSSRAHSCARSRQCLRPAGAGRSANGRRRPGPGRLGPRGPGLVGSGRRRRDRHVLAPEQRAGRRAPGIG
jgi:predicted Zn-dependent protease